MGFGILSRHWQTIFVRAPLAMPPTLWPTSLPASRCPSTRRSMFLRVSQVKPYNNNNNNNKDINYNTQLELKQKEEGEGEEVEKKQQASGRLVKAAKQKQGNRKRQQSRMTKQPRRRDVAVGGSALAERVMKTKKKPTKLIIKQKEKQRNRCAKSPTVSPRLYCVFKFGPFPYYLAYSYIKCSHKMASKAKANNNNNGVCI